MSRKELETLRSYKIERGELVLPIGGGCIEVSSKMDFGF